MLYSCAYTWHHGTTPEQVSRQILAAHEAGLIDPLTIRGYYSLVGGGAGFLVVEVEDPAALNRALAPSMSLMSWDVRALIERDYQQDLDEIRREVGQGT